LLLAPEHLYTVAEVAAVLRVSTATVYKLCNTGRLGCVRFVNVIRVPASALRQYTSRVHKAQDPPGSARWARWIRTPHGHHPADAAPPHGGPSEARAARAPGRGQGVGLKRRVPEEGRDMPLTLAESRDLWPSMTTSSSLPGSARWSARDARLQRRGCQKIHNRTRNAGCPAYPLVLAAGEQVRASRVSVLAACLMALAAGGRAAAQATPPASPCPPDGPCAAAPAVAPGDTVPGLDPSAATAARPVPQEPPPRARAGWYLGFDFGMGYTDARSSTGWMGFGYGSGSDEEEGQVLLPNLLAFVIPALGVQLGLPVGRRVLIGIEGNTIFRLVTDSERNLLISQLLATATFFPLERPELAAREREVAPRGWYLRGGAGAAFLRSSSYSETTPAGPAWNATGWAISAGTGMAVWLGSRDTATANAGLDIAYQSYDSGPEEPRWSYSLVFKLGLVLF
jgi:excisionase family DNA binding protein